MAPPNSSSGNVSGQNPLGCSALLGGVIIAVVAGVILIFITPAITPHPPQAASTSPQPPVATQRQATNAPRVDQPSRVIQVTVDARTQRNSTGVYLTKGQRFAIRYVGGSWQAGPSPTWPKVGIKGDPQVPRGQNLQFPLPNEYVMTMIAGIGTLPPYPATDERFEMISPSDGILWLGPNDDSLFDNSGSITIEIAIW